MHRDKKERVGSEIMATEALEHNAQSLGFQSTTALGLSPMSQRAKNRRATKETIKAIRNGRCAMLQRYHRYALVAVLNTLAEQQGITNMHAWIDRIADSEPRLHALFETLRNKQ